MSAKGKDEERKVDIQVIADDIKKMADKLLESTAKSLAQDYQDDTPRNKAIKGLDELRRDFYGPVTERQDAQLVHVIDQLKENMELDHSNDKAKQEERDIAEQIKDKADKLLHLVREGKK